MTLLNLQGQELAEKLDELYLSGLGAVSEDFYRDVSDNFPMLHTLPQPQKPILIQYAEALQAHDEKMIGRFVDMLEKKTARYDHLMAQDRFDMTDAEANRIQTQLRFLTEEIEILNYLAKLMTRYFERWFAPEMARVNELYVESMEKHEKETAFWKDMYFREAERTDEYLKWLLGKTERIIETDEKLNRYQMAFIKSNITITA